MAKMTEAERDKFLAEIRFGYLTTLTGDGAPRTVPVWYDWDGHIVKIFTNIGSPKVKRIQRDPRVTLLVANDRSEYEAWVSFDGTAEIRMEGSVELIEKLAKRYWDLSDPNRQAMLNGMKSASALWCIIEWVPTQIRTYR